MKTSEPDPPRKVTGLKRQAVRGMWRLLLIVFLNAVVNLSLFFDLENAFLNSLVTCPEPVPDPTCPLGSTLNGTRCVAEPPTSANWSFSVHCADQHLVLNTGRTMSTTFQTAGGISGIVSILLIGPLIDAFGRKPVIILSLCGGFVKSALQVLASLVIGHPRLQKAVVLAAVVVFSLTNNFMLAASAMAADMAPLDTSGRAATFSALAFVQMGSMAVGFLGGYLVLKENFTSYTLVWFGSAAANVLIAILACFLLRETVREPDSEGTSTSESSSDTQASGHHPLRRLKAACGIFGDFFRDGVLGQLILLWSLFCTTTMTEFLSRQVLLGPLKYSQAAASLTSIFHPALGAVGSAMSGKCVRRLDASKVLGMVLFVMALGHACTGLCIALDDDRGLLFWAGEVLIGLSAGILHPVSNAIFSVRVDHAGQGMLFSLLSLAHIFGRMVGVQVFVKRMFNSNWTGWKGGAVFFALSAVVTICIPWLAVITGLDKRNKVKDGTDSESSFEMVALD